MKLDASLQWGCLSLLIAAQKASLQNYLGYDIIPLDTIECYLYSFLRNRIQGG